MAVCVSERCAVCREYFNSHGGRDAICLVCRAKMGVKSGSPMSIAAPPAPADPIYDPSLQQASRKPTTSSAAM